MNGMRRLVVTVVVGVLTTAALVAGSGAAVAASTRSAPPELGPRVCSVLTHLKIPRFLIGLPTGGAEVSSATWNASGYCSVVGRIWPSDAGSPRTQFQVNLPRDWNGRALQFGAGEYDGGLVTGLGQYSAQPVDEPAPIDQGYVTLGSDGGHQGAPGFDGSFGLDDEALLNDGHQSVKKAHDAAMVVILAAYWTKPAYFYFAGGSHGGREALNAAARYPKDYNGVIANYPVYNVTMMHAGAVNFRDALYGDGGTGWLSPAKTKLITDAVYATCDGLDGASDQLVSDVSGCNDAFDVSVLRCPTGADEGGTCLSDGQLAAAVKIATDYDLGFEIAGNRVFAKSALFEGALYRGLSGFKADSAPSNPIPRDGVDRVQKVGEITDVTDVSLDSFRVRGGKILMAHGTADDVITPHNTIQYYERKLAGFGSERLASFLRFYDIPGWGHGRGPFTATYDGLGALTAWVERGTAPAKLIAFDANPGANRSRPMCEYPGWPRYTGSGRVADAASYECVAG